VHGATPPKICIFKIFKIFKNCCYTTTTAAMEAALADLRLQDVPNITATAKMHKINRSTLSRRWNKVTRSREESYDSMRFLNTIQSKALIKYINDLTERGLPPTVAMVENIAAEIVGRQPGHNWPTRWLAAHKDELKSGYLAPIDIARKKADSALYYSLYFELLGRKIAEYDILPENTYNMDEKGFLIGYLKKSRRIFSKSAFNSSRVNNIN